jgi:ubiquinone/menaquinone biosynthesis C-methylase UbiE
MSAMGPERKLMSSEQYGFEGREELYERVSVPFMGRPLAHALIGYTPVGKGMRILDLACGTGIVARIVAQRIGPNGIVRGIDSNLRMLEVAKTHAPGKGASIEWHEGDATTLPFENSSFDVVFCQQGLQFIPDKAAALGEIHRVLAPGGTLGISLWRKIDYSPYHLAKEEALARHVGPEAAEKERNKTPFSLGDDQVIKKLLVDSGFYDVEVHAEELHLWDNRNIY